MFVDALRLRTAVEKFDLRTLKMMFSGAAPLGGPLVKALRARLLKLGADVVVSQGMWRLREVRPPVLILPPGYGLTETSPTTHLLPAAECMRKVGTIGPLLPNLEARLVVEDVREATSGEPGELWLRGPSIMKVRSAGGVWVRYLIL